MAVKFLRALGPGILFAATAIGVSHLVQSTRAGALFGYGLIWAVIAANLFKYPFFEFGARYANATGKNLLQGYHEISPWLLRIYVLATLGSMITVTAGVSIVTAALLAELTGFSGSLVALTALLFAACILILLAGQYRLLDRSIKLIALILLGATLVTFFVALGHPIETAADFQPKSWLEGKGNFLFVIALMGWMPTAVDLSTWSSLWTLARIKESGYHPTLRETLLDFRIGYWISAILAVVFVILGARLLYFPHITVPEGANAFVHVLISIYTQNLGSWSYYVILIAAASIMFSTTITVFDGYARALKASGHLLFPEKTGRLWYALVVMVLAAGGLILIGLFANKMAVLLDLATSISFLIAPIIAWFNYKVIFSKTFPDHAKPGWVLHLLTILGLVFLVVFTLWYLWVVLF